MNRKVLIVDDEPDVMKILMIQIKRAGYEVLVAENGQEGVDMAVEHNPGLILMDYRMPVLNGLEAAQKIREKDCSKEIPIIFLTASSTSISDEEMKEVQNAILMKKPFEIPEILEKINEILNKEA